MGRRSRDLTSKVLRHIRGYYREALEQLPEEEFPSLLSAGVCFGLLDPVSNIIVNTATADKEGGTQSSRKNRKRKRSERIAEEVEEERKVLTEAARGIANRSLDGLLTFLVCYFPYLHTREALRYLRLAKSDLVVAVCLIDLDRCVATSSATAAVNPIKTSVQVALKCAAISAKHPCPATLTDTWFSLANLSLQDQQRQLHELSSRPLLEALRLPLSLTMALGRLHTPRQQKALLLYHEQRSRDREKKVVYPALTEARRSQLHNMIHRIYLKAIARLPRDALHLRHHRGLLKAGYCFGPMDDPVSNILLNTIWYDTMFPIEEFLADMLCTRSLMRVESRSAVGLIKFLCTRFLDLSEHDAIMFLLEADANIHEAVSRAEREGHDPSGSLEESYREASLVAWHPDPEVWVKFAVSTMPSSVESCLTFRGDCTLSAEDVEAISESLEVPLGSPSSQSCRVIPEELSPVARDMVTHQWETFDDDRFFFRRFVETALQEFTEKSKCWMPGPEYRLHVICGVNTRVAEPDYRHPYCHINFLARPRSLPSAKAAPELFFVECSYNDEDTEVVRCCVVDPSTDSGRCFYCEMRGTKIVHPSFGKYRGCDTNFEEMACGEGLTVANEELISYGTRRAEYLGWLKEEDGIYFDRRRDFKLAEVINKAYEKKEDLNPVYTEPIR